MTVVGTAILAIRFLINGKNSFEEDMNIKVSVIMRNKILSSNRYHIIQCDDRYSVFAILNGNRRMLVSTQRRAKPRTKSIQ